MHLFAVLLNNSIILKNNKINAKFNNNIEIGYNGVNISMNYSNADEYCVTTYGTHLATITSSIDNQYALIAATDAKIIPDNKFWIGYNDIKNEGNFTWIDGTINTNYTNWKDGEPSANAGNSSENTDCTNVDTNGKWYNINCSQTNGFICNAVITIINNITNINNKTLFISTTKHNNNNEKDFTNNNEIEKWIIYTILGAALLVVSLCVVLILFYYRQKKRANTIRENAFDDTVYTQGKQSKNATNNQNKDGTTSTIVFDNQHGVDDLEMGKFTQITSKSPTLMSPRTNQSNHNAEYISGHVKEEQNTENKRLVNNTNNAT